MRVLGRCLLCLVLLMFLSYPSYATTRNVTCSGDIASALQTAIDASSNGDTVSISSGSCTSNSIDTWTNKNIIITGAGKGVTNISTNTIFLRLFMTTSASPSWQITNFSLGGSSSGAVIQLWGTHDATWRGGWRIDHLVINYPGSTSDGMIQVWGPIYGLIDHTDFTMLGEAAILTSLELDTDNCSFNVGGTCTLLTLQGGEGVAIPFDPGGPANLYIEDNTFTGLNTSIGAGAIDTAYGGGRYVFRYNTLTNSYLYAHWTAGGSANSLWWEIYNNTSTFSMDPNSGMYPMRMQGGGTGIIHDNTISGYPSNYILVGDPRANMSQSGAPNNYCDGMQTIDGNAGDGGAPGWPCLVQIGRNMGPTISQIIAGTKEGSFPLYVWNNGPQAKCSNPAAGGSACDNSFTVGIYGSSAYIKATPHSVSGGGYGQGDVDYSITSSQPSGAGTHTLTYTDYTYPHPLQGAGCSSASKIVVTSQPSSVQAGVSLGTVRVSVEDSSNVVCSSATDSITLAKNGSATWGTLSSSSSLTKSAVGGVATWTDLSISSGGSGTIDASASGLTGDSTTSITITDCTPAKVVFTDQPADAGLSSSLGTTAVSIESSGNVICQAATNSITLSKNAGATWGTLTSSSSLTKAASSGVATWSDLSVTTTAGSGSIDASASGLTGDVSNSITISAGCLSTSSHVQTVKVDTTGTSTSFGPITVTAGNLLVVFVRYGDATGSSYTISDGKNTYTNVYSYNDTYGNHVEVWYVASASSGSTTVTVGGNPSSNTIRGNVSEFSGLLTSSVLDLHVAHAEATGVTMLTGTAGTPSSACEMLIGYVEVNSTTQTFTVGNVGSGTGTVPTTTGTTAKTQMAYHNETAAAAYTASWSWTATDSASVILLSFVDNTSAGCTPSKLVFTSQPSNTTVGHLIGTVLVAIEDSAGNVCTDSVIPITVARDSASGWACLQGSRIKTPVNGVATFPDLSVIYTGGRGSLAASGSGLQSGTSSPFTVTSPGLRMSCPGGCTCPQ